MDHQYLDTSVGWQGIRIKGSCIRWLFEHQRYCRLEPERSWDVRGFLRRFKPLGNFIQRWCRWLSWQSRDWEPSIDRRKLKQWNTRQNEGVDHQEQVLVPEADWLRSNQRQEEERRHARPNRLVGWPNWKPQLIGSQLKTWAATHN